MPYFKCVPCEIRLNSAAAQSDLADAMCPSCGRPLEPVGQLVELIGFRSLDLPERPPATGVSDEGHQRLVVRVADIMARRDAKQARFAAQRWLDESGSFSSAAVAELPANEPW